MLCGRYLLRSFSTVVFKYFYYCERVAIFNSKLKTVLFFLLIFDHFFQDSIFIWGWQVHNIDLCTGAVDVFNV